MNNYILPRTLADCGHCGEKDSLSYYMEGSKNTDLYWCGKCYMVTVWNGIKTRLKDMEAYPNRDKV